MNSALRINWHVLWIVAILLTTVNAQSPSNAPKPKSSYMPVVDNESFDSIHLPMTSAKPEIMN